ncbi:RDD family protein [Halostreptopolyspora alba]|uniref:RDD family protein n=1 Tax=Halostreptopolyspora alba TaxID=2487137 RepID=A0A3N0E126_9ACTN|nr:RDD family protein [Nocardiopsaceae bacterium YIM 96095]
MTHPGGGAYDDQSSVVTGDAVVLDLRPAGFATRMVALAFDLVIQVTVLAGANLAAVRVGADLDPAAMAAVIVGVTVLTVVGYPTAVETLSRGRSVGKLVMGLRVVGADGSPEQFRQALARALCAVVEIWAASGVIALLSSMINRDGRRIGDFVAGTLVIEERAGREPETEIAMPPWLAEWAAAAEMSALTPETVAMARQYVLRYSELTEQARHEMGNRIAGLVSAGVTPPPPEGTPPVAYLAAVLAERRRREEEKLARRQGRHGAPHTRQE